MYFKTLFHAAIVEVPDSVFPHTKEAGLGTHSPSLPHTAVIELLLSSQ